MFSEVQRDYIMRLYNANRKEYPYYIAYTKTNVSNNYISDDVSFYVILSKDEIIAHSKYEYVIPNDSMVFAVKSGNASYNYHSERVVNSHNSGVLNVNNYEFIYTNATFTGITLQPDINADNHLHQDIFNGFSIALLIVLISVIMVKILRG